MGLSNDLISQFVKATKDEQKTKSESTVYGKIREEDGNTYVQIDGSELLTPVSATTNVKDGERVIVTIKNHTATVTGNMTSPSARNLDLDNTNVNIKKVENLLSDTVTTEELYAESARIDKLETENVTVQNKLTANAADISTLKADTVTIKNDLSANTANITKIQTEKLDANAADIKYATIEALDATNADVYNLEATYGDFSSLTTTRLGAIDASIDDLEAGQAKITNLESEVADINTLMFGSATGDTIQTEFSNAVIAQLGNAQIKSAMIESVSADKITAGDIITNDVRVLSEDGKLLISDETIQISDDARVRVQIGKDDSGDYSINVWDVNGNLMFSEGGITDSAIKEAIIRNDMVSENANISASKLDIDSLFGEINGSSNTIKSTKIYLDDEGQTLDVAFTSLTTEVDELQNGVSSQGTQISAIQGQISSKIWQQDINTAKNELEEQTETLSSKYTTLEQEIDGISATVADNTTAISKKADNTTVTSVTNRVSTLETGLSGFQSTVSETYATKTEVDLVSVGGRNLLSGADNAVENSNYGLTGYIYADPTQIVAGKEYTVSFDGMLSDPVQTGFYINTYPSPYPQCVIIPAIATDGEYHHYEATFVMPNNGSYTSLGIYSNTPGNNKLAGVKNIKLEKGNRATDWTLAPEDIDAEIININERVTSAESSITQLSNKITANVTETTNLGTRTSTLEQTADGLTLRLDNTTSGIEAASKTATDYLGFSSGGLVVGDMTKDVLGNNVLIDSDSVDIRNGSTTLASFGADYLYLAKNSRNATIDMCNGLATMYHASKYSYDSLFVIDTAVVEMIGASTPLCLTSTSSLENVSIQFANSSKVLGGIGIIGSWLRRYGSNMYDTYTILDSGNFHDVMDGGWVHCTYGDGFTRYSNSQANIQVRKIGKQVYLRGEAKPTTAVTPESETSTVLAVIPEGYRPSYRQNFIMQGSSAYRWLMSVYPGGNICISRYTNDTTMNKSISAGAWLCCYAQWTID